MVRWQCLSAAARNEGAVDLVSPIEGAIYAARQAARIAWYGGAYAMARRMQGPLRDAAGQPIRASTPTPNQQALLADIGALFRRDIANAARGVYRVPNDWFAPLAREIALMRRFMADVPKVAQRRRDGIADEPLHHHRGARPRYYLQNFHFQSGGWMTEDSAELYDTQVDVLFSGATAAMRRQALPPIAEHLRGRDQRHARLLDIAAGTAHWVRDLRVAFPALPVTLLDMSEAYLARARRDLGADGRRRETVAAAEAMPFAAGSHDVITAIYLFHELPPKVRREVAREVARVLRPGGLFVVVDSIQTGEHPPYDGLLELFPIGFHEPYFSSYLDEDFDTLFGAEGLLPVSRTRAFLSTIMCFRRCAEPSARS
jgi:ubiquinone/menaquinone biosynthesis C-methylase UbiE